jgi:uncharacterized protein (DUF302 family)
MIIQFYIRIGLSFNAVLEQTIENSESPCRTRAKHFGQARIEQRNQYLLLRAIRSGLLGRANSFNVRKVLWVCDEIGVPFVREDFGRGFKPTNTPELLELNLTGQVPVVIDGSRVMRESNTIVRYLAAKHRAIQLYPDDLGQRQAIEQWMDWVAYDVTHALRIDHAAAAKDAGLEMRPRTLIIFRNPKAGTPPMTKSATLAIDLPMKALVWQDDQNKVWLTYNSSEYGARQIYPRNGLTVSDEAAEMLEKFLADVSDQSTQ